MSVQSIERAFSILRAVAQAPSGIGITELAQRTDLHKSTVSRLVSALEAEAVVARAPKSGDVCLGEGILALLTPLHLPDMLKTLARPYMRQLSDQVQETVGLCVPDGHTVHYIDQIYSNHAVQVRDWTGERYPLHVTSSGKLFLAYAAEKLRRQYLDTALAAYTAHSFTDPCALSERLEEVRGQGYDWSFEEFELGLVVASGPIFDAAHNMVASIYTCGPIYRFPVAMGKQAITQMLLATCSQITQRLQSMSYRDANREGRDSIMEALEQDYQVIDTTGNGLSWYE